MDQYPNLYMKEFYSRTRYNTFKIPSPFQKITLDPLVDFVNHVNQFWKPSIWVILSQSFTQYTTFKIVNTIHKFTWADFF